MAGEDDPTGWSYGSDPANSPSDHLRFQIGDTDPGRPLLRNGEVTHILAMARNDPTQAAIIAIESVIAGSVGFVDESVGSVSISHSQRMDNLKDILKMLLSKASRMRVVMPYAGGVYKSDVASQEAEPNRVTPRFTTPESAYHRDGVPSTAVGMGRFGRLR